ncbi:ATP-dependent zinc metalloprotease FtsH [subsurface metagenome]
MVSYFGMSDKVGNLSFYDSTGQNEFTFNKPYSEKTAELIDDEVKHLIDKAYNRAMEVLKKNKKGLTQLAELLLEKEVIFSEDVEIIFGKKRGNITKETQSMLMKTNSKSSSGITKKKPPKKEEPGK